MPDLTKQLHRSQRSLWLALIPLSVIGWITIDLITRYQGIYLILFCVFYVYIPGLLTIFAFWKGFYRRYGHWINVVAFYLGFTLLIVQYYLFNALHVLFLIKIIPVIWSAAMLFLIRKDRKIIPSVRSRISKFPQALPFLMLLAVILFANYYIFLYTMPNETDNLFVDYCYHMGNINILTRGGSLDDTRVMGMTFKYHYFSDLFTAICRLIFPSTIWNCLCRYPILYVSPLLAGSLYSFMRGGTKNRILCAVASAFIVVFPSMTPTYTLYTYNVLTSVNAVGFAVPPVLCISELIYRSVVKDHRHYGDLVLLFLLTVCLTGLKGPFSLALIGGMVVFLAVTCIKKRRISLFRFLIPVVMAAGFCIVWFTLLNVAVNDGNINSEASGLISLFDLEIRFPSLPFTDGYARDSKHAILFIPLNLVNAFGGIAIPYMLSVPVLLFLLFRRPDKKIDYRSVFYVICACVGVGGDYLLALGRNKVYFLMFAVPYVFYCGISFLKFVMARKKKALTVFYVLLLGLTCYYEANAVVKSSLKPMYVWGTGKLSDQERDATDWIRNNTDENALFAINLDSPDGKKYYYSAFTERRFYIECYDYSMNSGKTAEDLEGQIETNSRIYSDPATAQITGELGIDYLIYIGYNGEIPELLESTYTLCYSNEQVRVYSCH